MSLKDGIEQEDVAIPVYQRRSLVWIAWLLMVLGCGLLMGVIVMAFARRDVPIPDLPDSEPWYSGVFNALGTLSMLATGVYLTLKMPRNNLAWLMLLAGFGYALHLFAVGYIYISFLVSPLLLTELMFVLAAAGLGLLLPTIPLIVILFPSGRLPSSRWRFAYGIWLFVIVMFGGFSWLSPFGKWVPFDNPLALEGSAAESVSIISTFAWFSFLGLLIIATISAIIRGLRSEGQERQQFKWLVVATVFILLSMLWPVNITEDVWGYSVGYYVINMLSIAAIPLAIAIAVMRYRLWDVDVVIRRTTQYAIVTALLALIYFGTVIALQRVLDEVFGLASSNVAIVLSTLLIAALFTPVRRRVQDHIDHRFYRRKYDAEKVLTQFAATVRDETDLDELTAELVRVIQETMQPDHVSIWLKPVLKSLTIDEWPK
jgi:hypothetical protein